LIFIVVAPMSVGAVTKLSKAKINILNIKKYLYNSGGKVYINDSLKVAKAANPFFLNNWTRR
ncbi:MAG: hypothetical protein V1898_01000, partial [Patescibacteria group bacterium]